MNSEDEARLAKAAMKSLLVAAPESLKAGLKRMARNRKPRTSAWGALREALSGGAWAYGAGAAFSAAAVAVVLLRASGPREAAPSVARRPVQRVEAAAQPQYLAELWSDDTGEDNDEI